MTYFDHNATAPLLRAAREAWLQASEEFVGNPSSPHRVGARAEVALADARERLANLLGCRATELMWTSGATEANNFVFHHFSGILPSDRVVWVSAIEHPCVIESAFHYFPGRVRTIPVKRHGLVDSAWLLENLPNQKPGLVAMMAANNVTGVIQPWRQVAAICRDHEVPFFCDAVQWVGKEPSGVLAECDFVSGCAHKVGGPRGIGFLKCPSHGRVRPLLLGGPQEDGRRAGTENVAGALALVATLEARAESFLRDDATLRRSWRDQFEQSLVEELPGTEILGQNQPRLWNTVAALMPECDGPHRWLVKLDKHGFAASTGSACSSGREAPSSVLLAMGYEPLEASRILRFSSGWETSLEDWMALLRALKRVHQELRDSEGAQNHGKPRRGRDFCRIESE